MRKKQGVINRINEEREDYTETREEGFMKNYKSLRYKEESKFRRSKLKKIWQCVEGT